MSKHREVDCLIVGGGPGGLTAATYLGRFRRSVTVVDAGESRLKIIPLARNVPGFFNGVTGLDLLARLREQAKRYGATLVEDRVTGLKQDDARFDVQCVDGAFRARTVLLATGVQVTDPAMPDLDLAIARGLIRYCPVCDGFEATDMRIAVLGGRPASIEEAHFLRTYSGNVVYQPMPGSDLTPDQIQRATDHGIEVEHSPCIELAISGDVIEAVLASGDRRTFDVVYPCLGSAPRSELAASVGVRLSDKGELMTDRHYATNVPGLYAAGDVLRGLDQIASACGQAAVAATAIHNLLRKDE